MNTVKQMVINTLNDRRFMVYQDDKTSAIDNISIIDLQGLPVDQDLKEGEFCSLGTNKYLSFSNFGMVKIGRHLGKKVRFSSLPKNVQKHILKRFSEECE